MLAIWYGGMCLASKFFSELLVLPSHPLSSGPFFWGGPYDSFRSPDGFVFFFFRTGAEDGAGFRSRKSLLGFFQDRDFFHGTGPFLFPPSPDLVGGVCAPTTLRR